MRGEGRSRAVSNQTGYEVEPPNFAEMTIQEKYRFGKTLGKGVSCRVVQGAEKGDRARQVAIKIMSRKKSATRKFYDQELRVLSQLSRDGTVHHSLVAARTPFFFPILV